MVEKLNKIEKLLGELIIDTNNNDATINNLRIMNKILNLKNDIKNSLNDINELN